MCSVIKTSVSGSELKNNSRRATETPPPPLGIFGVYDF